jgi:carbon storage regulator
MLVLSRKPDQRIIIDGDISLTVVEVSGKGVRLGIDAPKDVCILREELVGQEYQHWVDDETPDPDLEGKPAEWEEAIPSPVFAE